MTTILQRHERVANLRADFLAGKISKFEFVEGVRTLGPHTPTSLSVIPFFFGVPNTLRYWDEDPRHTPRQKAFLAVHSTGTILKAIDAGIEFVPYSSEPFRLGGKRARDYKELL